MNTASPSTNTNRNHMTSLGKGLGGAAVLATGITMTPTVASLLPYPTTISWIAAGGIAFIWDLTWGYTALTGLRALNQGNTTTAKRLLGVAGAMLAASVAAMLFAGHLGILAALPVAAAVLLVLGHVGSTLADEDTEAEILANRVAARNDHARARSEAADIRVMAEAKVLRDAAEGDAEIAAEVLKVEIADRRHAAITAAMNAAGQAIKARDDETREGVQAFQNAISRPLPAAPSLIDLRTPIKPLTSDSASEEGADVKPETDTIKRPLVPVADGLTGEDLTTIAMVKDGKSGAEIAAVLKVSPAAVSQRLGRLAKHGHVAKVDGRWQLTKPDQSRTA